MRWHALTVGLTACVVVAGAALAQDNQGAWQSPVARAEAAAAALESTPVGDAELAAADRLRAAYPGVQLYRQGTTLARVYGRTLGMGDSPEQVAAQFLAENADLFAAESADLLPITRVLEQGNQLPLMHDPETGTYKLTLLYYSQYRDGVPVFRSDVRLLVRNEPGFPLVWAGSNLKRLEAFRPNPSLTSSVSPSQIAPDMRNFTPAEPVIWAGLDEDSVTPRQAVTFEAGNEDGPQRWLYVVDAENGEVLYKENRILFTDVTGSVHGLATTIPKSDACNPEVDTPMKWAKVAIGSTTAYADGSGNFTIPNSGSSQVTVTSSMAGQYFTVDNLQGAEETMTLNVTPPGPANFMHNSDNVNEQTRSQVNAYVQANVVRDWVLTYHPTYPTIYTQTNFPLKVNSTSWLYCPGNAWYDYSSLNFCKSGSSYPNTAYSSVVHHEYGHHIVDRGGSGQGQYGEGMGDSVAVCIADDPILGYGFTGNCSAGIRTANNTVQYPCSGEVHACAPLLSGCVWSTRNQLIVTNPGTYLSILSKLTVNSVPMHSGTTTSPTIYTDWITLDNNYYGGAHVAEITAGFAAHNMVPADTTAPAPNPMTFASAPAAASSASITMTATTATDATPPVSYFFDFVSGGSGGTDSGWQTSTTYIDVGLSPNTSYIYRVKARDSAATPNETGYSSNFSAVTWANVPTAPTLSGATGTTLNLDVNANGNPTATEFAVLCTAATPSDSTWVGKYVNASGAPSASAVWRTDALWGTTTVTGLEGCTSYTLAVKARNSQSVETAFGAAASQSTTGRQGDLTGDDSVDGADIQAFVSCRVGGGDGCGCANLSVSAFVSCLLNAGSCP